MHLSLHSKTSDRTQTTVINFNKTQVSCDCHAFVHSNIAMKIIRKFFTLNEKYTLVPKQGFKNSERILFTYETSSIFEELEDILDFISKTFQIFTMRACLSTGVWMGMYDNLLKFLRSGKRTNVIRIPYFSINARSFGKLGVQLYQSIGNPIVHIDGKCALDNNFLIIDTNNEICIFLAKVVNLEMIEQLVKEWVTGARNITKLTAVNTERTHLWNITKDDFKRIIVNRFGASICYERATYIQLTLTRKCDSKMLFVEIESNENYGRFRMEEC